MSEKKPPDLSKDEVRLIEATLVERFGEKIPVQLADVELRLTPGSIDMTLCPCAYWEVGDVHFLIARTDRYHFFGTFYYRGYQQYGTEKRRYDDLFDCITSTLKAHEEYEEKERERLEKEKG